MEFKPYEVVEDDEECPHCGGGQTWTIRQPDGVILGQSFIEESDAYEMCNLLNSVFSLGQQSSLTKEGL